MLLWRGNTKNLHDIVWPAGEMTGSAFGEMEDFSMKKTIYANPEPISDREAIQRLALAAKAGEQAAKEALCERFKGLIYSLSKTAYETLPAEETRQELWLGFLECLEKYDEKSRVSFLSYITQRMRWRAVDICRGHQKRLAHEMTASSSETAELLVTGEIASDGPVPNWYEVDWDYRISMQEGNPWDLIPWTKKQKELLFLRLAGLSWPEIAERTHTSPSVIYRHAKKMQKGYLEAMRGSS